jgi:hypothetical protein
MAFARQQLADRIVGRRCNDHRLACDGGIVMIKLRPVVVFGVLGLAVALAFLLDMVKLGIFARLRMV